MRICVKDDSPLVKVLLFFSCCRERSSALCMGERKPCAINTSFELTDKMWRLINLSTEKEAVYLILQHQESNSIIIFAIRSLAYICILCVLGSAHAGGYVSLGFSVVGVFKRVFGIGFFSRRVTSAVSFCFLIHVSVFFVSLKRISDQIEWSPC